MLLNIRGIKLQVIISICLYTGAIVGGYSGSWAGPIIPKLRDLGQSPLPYMLTETQMALVGSFGYLGAIPGPYITIWLSNTRGRKPCLIAGSLIAVLAYLLLAISRNLATMYIGRLLTSVSFGTVTVVNFLYIGEMASSNIRGILMSIIGGMFTVGSILVFATGPSVSYYGTCYIGLAISIAHMLSLFWIPESPIYYALQGKDEELKRVLHDLGRSQEIDNLLKMRKENISETTTKKDWTELFSIRSNRKALFIVVIINILQHCSGVMAVLTFSAAIFDLAGSSIKSNIAMVIIGCCQLLGSTITPFFIENKGRKVILIISSAVCSLSMFLLGLYFYLDLIGSSVVNSIKWLPLVVLILFYMSYDFGLGIIPTTIIGEMFTTNVRSKGSTLTMTTSWLFGFLIATAFGALLEAVGGHVLFWFFSIMCACAALFTAIFLPETKGKTLLEIQEAL